jgi:hypothetical protein
MPCIVHFSHYRVFSLGFDRAAHRSNWRHPP